MQTQKLVLKGGKFYRGKELVPIEFGNWEQIKLIEEKQEELKAIHGEGLIVDVWVEEITYYMAKADFKCIECDSTVDIEQEVDDEDDKDDILGECKCWKCRAIYEIKKNSDGDYVVKHLKNPTT